jgi:hypothetical protein
VLPCAQKRILQPNFHAPRSRTGAVGWNESTRNHPFLIRNSRLTPTNVRDDKGRAAAAGRARMPAR